MQFINDLPKDIHPCGEHGEYHTFVLDGPLFQRRIEITEAEKKLKDGSWLLDILGYRLGEK